MEIWLLFGGAVAVVGVVAFNAGGTFATSPAKVRVEQLTKQLSHDRMCYLSTLRRELANLLVWDDPAKFLSVYRAVLAETLALQGCSKAERDQRASALSAKYPVYEDFDKIGTRPYVLYADAVSWHEFGDLAQVYRDIAIFQTILMHETGEKRIYEVASEKEAQHLEKYVNRLLDTKLKLDIDQAVQAYFASGRRWTDRTPLDAPDFSVVPVPHFAGNRLGVTVKVTGEHGLFGAYDAGGAGSSGENRTYRAYLRSDADFTSERTLDTLPAVEDWRRTPSGRGPNARR